MFLIVPGSARLHEAELANVLDRLAGRRAEGDESDASLDLLMPDRWIVETLDAPRARDC